MSDEVGDYGAKPLLVKSVDLFVALDSTIPLSLSFRLRFDSSLFEAKNFVELGLKA